MDQLYPLLIPHHRYTEQMAYGLLYRPDPLSLLRILRAVRYLLSIPRLSVPRSPIAPPLPRHNFTWMIFPCHGKIIAMHLPRLCHLARLYPSHHLSGLLSQMSNLMRHQARIESCTLKVIMHPILYHSLPQTPGARP